MLDRKFRNKGLFNFRYKDTQWFKTIRSETRLYKFQVIGFVLAASLIIPVALGFSHISSPYQLPALVYTGVFVVFAAELAFFVKMKKIRAMTLLLLGELIVGLVCSLFLQGGYALALLLLSVCPLLATQLRGSRRGSYYFSITLAVFLLTYVLQVLRCCQAPFLFFTARDTLLLVTTVTIFILSYYAERRQETLVARFVDLLVFDESTDFQTKMFCIRVSTRASGIFLRSSR